jgi:hypothetical protein
MYYVYRARAAAGSAGRGGAYGLGASTEDKGELWPQEQAVAPGSEPPLSGDWQLLLGPSGTALGSVSLIQQKRGVLMPLHHWLRSAS